MSHRVFLVEDEAAHREMLAEALIDAGYEVIAAATGQQALDALSHSTFDVALVDICLPDVDGFGVLDLLRTQQPACPVLLMTGQATIEAAVSAMKRGAYDFLAKPFRLELMLLKLERLFQLVSLEKENRDLRKSTQNTNLVGSSPEFRRFLEAAENVAGSSATILIQGESGTGKELVADLIHSRSPVKDGPLVKVNCGAIPESLLEAELFGYGKGAFTGAERDHRGYLEQAQDGTLFLDEIGEIPHAMQVKLLRVLQERQVRRLGGEKAIPVSFRLVAATNRDFSQLREEGVIRKDFFYRLHVVPLKLPPLRRRQADIPLLVDHFIRKYANRYAKPPIRLRPESLERLQAYPFPGNVRELENLIERLQVMSPGTEISPRDLPIEMTRQASEGSPVFQCFRTELPLKEAIHDFERRFIQRVLEEEGGNRTAAAKRLGISRKNLWEKLVDR
ncbi:acetoacetate metabolism regulatory protein AtoC [Desulfuromonas versatilis]|uniref:Acetoacetate metabolism regulatory protein AtoC n=1 Tax=Desulfuromonas versatilis TaxID=2802975 RepID=A0ABN6DX10_9BACT|nr:sigma-54 dependent transcriptional regulator [Desulfuromonas versatilis]BCR03701.1 acetoacetate metabolism regulatory protein AtoC [Desulfuromonas versatilis]